MKNLQKHDLYKTSKIEVVEAFKRRRRKNVKKSYVKLLLNCINEIQILHLRLPTNIVCLEEYSSLENWIFKR